jgi:tetratricopeptide (TPR) repeat protein
MLARLLLFAAVIVPLCAQDAAQDSDVTKYLDELRAKISAPPELNAEARQRLADIAKHLDETTDPVRRAHVYLDMSLIEQSLGDPEAAVAAARNALALQPGNGQVAIGVARVLAYNGQTAEVSAMIGANATDGAALIRRAQELAQADNNLPVAAFCYDLARKLLPDDPGVPDAQGQIYMREGFGGQAAIVFLQAIARAPQVSTYHYHLALARIQTGLISDGRAELQIALECRPPDEERAAIQATLARLGRPQ